MCDIFNFFLHEAVFMKQTQEESHGCFEIFFRRYNHNSSLIFDHMMILITETKEKVQESQQQPMDFFFIAL